ncbi:MAG: hypothetical protein AABZ12_02345 [Planctomycetota bacterium]
MGKLPFDARIFWSTLVIVVALVVGTWTIILKSTEYQITAADYGGTTISTIIFVYLVHLWMLPADKLRGEEHHENGHDETPNGPG